MKHQPILDKRPDVSGDLLSPADLYAHVVYSYRQKCRSSSVATLFGGMIGGALIGFAGLFYITIMTDNALGGGMAKLVGGMSFSLGLVMISILGAELFTGNILGVLPKAYGLISIGQVLKNWVAVYASNFFGVLSIGVAAATAGLLSGPIESVMDGIVSSKLAQSPSKDFIEGVLANFLVCSAIWMGLATQSPTGRVLCIAGPITAFVAMGLEHSIANMFFFSAAVLSGTSQAYTEMAEGLAVVTVGNIIGACLLCLFMGFTFRNGPTAKRLLGSVLPH